MLGKSLGKFGKTWSMGTAYLMNQKRLLDELKFRICVSVESRHRLAKGSEGLGIHAGTNSDEIRNRFQTRRKLGPGLGMVKRLCCYAAWWPRDTRK